MKFLLALLAYVLILNLAFKLNVGLGVLILVITLIYAINE